MNERIGQPAFEGEILLCEDSSMNQELIRSRLAKMGLTTITAQNGKEGVEQVKHRLQNGIKPFDLIFMDIYMPVMNGLEAAAEIGKLNTGTSIVAMTADSTSSDREHYAAHGISDCLNKPFTSQELLNCLLKYIEPVSTNQGFNNGEYHSDIVSADTQDDEELKIKLIHNFVKNNTNIYSEITQAIDDDDIKLAHRLAHTLKGNAGLLDKIRLQKAAEDVENLLSNEENRITQPVMNALKNELDAVLAEFAPLSAEDSSDNKLSGAKTETGIAIDNGQILSLLEELEALLDGGDVKCLNLIDRTSGLNLRSISGAAEPLVNGHLVQELIQQIKYFEFDLAMETLIQLKEGG